MPFRGAPVGEGRLAEADGASEGGDEARRDALHRRVRGAFEAVPEELRRRQQVAKLVVDLADREAELGQAALLAQLRGERPLHPGERRLGMPDLVGAVARRDDAVEALR